MDKIKSVIFITLFAVWTIFISLIFAPLLFAREETVCKYVGKRWAQGAMCLLELIFGLKLVVKGLENIPGNPVIFASKHQSQIETIAFWTIIKNPAYILKKELTYLPFFGIYLIKMGMVIINRAKGAEAIKQMISESKRVLGLGRSIIIFPEGTRGIYGAKPDYKRGIAAIYNTCNSQVVPVALNTGKYWPKGFTIHGPGTIYIEFLKPIEAGLSKDEFMQKLEASIEPACKKLD